MADVSAASQRLNEKLRQTAKEVSDRFGTSGDLVEFDSEGLLNPASLDHPSEPHSIYNEAPIERQVQDGRQVAYQPPEPKELIQKSYDDSVHPIFAKLDMAFGLKNLPVIKRSLNTSEGQSFEFGFSAYSEDMTTFIFETARREAKGDDLAMTIKLQALRVGISLVSINDAPLWEVFKIKPKDSKPFNPLNPPNYLRKLQTIAFVNWAISDANSHLLGSLLEYVEEFSKSFEPVKKGFIRYSCPLDECDVVEIFDTEQKPESVFCKFHKIELVPVRDTYDPN